MNIQKRVNADGLVFVETCLPKYLNNEDNALKITWFNRTLQNMKLGENSIVKMFGVKSLSVHSMLDKCLYLLRVLCPSYSGARAFMFFMKFHYFHRESHIRKAADAEGDKESAEKENFQSDDSFDPLFSD